MAVALANMAAACDDARSISNDASPNSPSTTRVDQSDTPLAINLSSNEETNLRPLSCFITQDDMGKRNGPPSDRVQAGRIEKQRRDEARSKLPAWYLRLSSQQYTKYRSVSPEAFDEDISELGESDKSGEVEDDAECECNSDASECDCGFEDENDNESEKTCEGSEAEFYYGMKDCRRERKRYLLEERRREEECLLEERKREEEAKESAMEYAKAREEEVNTAYTAFKKTQRRAKKKGETIPLDFGLSRPGGISYKLFSTQHVEWLFDYSMYPTQRADFHYLDECDGVPLPKDGEERPMFGMIYLNAMAKCDCGPIARPNRGPAQDSEDHWRRDVRTEIQVLREEIP
jgi:hypothetical protein